MSVVHFVSHPEVLIDPLIPVQRWSLTALGIDRLRHFSASAPLANTAEVWASTETKSIEGAGIVAARFGLPVHTDIELGENDRSATGFLPPDQFEHMADLFFASPDMSIRGWERAIDAQERVVRAFERVVARPVDGDIVMVGHGATGTLLYCHLANLAIDRRYDQPGAGHCWRYDLGARKVLHPWRSLEEAINAA